MMSSVAFALIAVLCAIKVQGAEDNNCFNNVVRACATSSSISETDFNCNAHFADFKRLEPEIQAFINLNLNKSYEYFLMATTFNSYQKDRPGFEKLYRSLSDRTFEDAIHLIKQLTRRGGKVDFSADHDRSERESHMELDELHSLAKALDNEKLLAKDTIHVHTRATHQSERDPHIAQYLEKKFLTQQVESIHKLSGYVNNLAKIMQSPDPSLGVYLFDEYLLKQ